MHEQPTLEVGQKVVIVAGKQSGRHATVINVIENRGHVTVRFVDEQDVPRETRLSADAVRVIAPTEADEVAREIVSALHASHGLWCDPNNIEYRVESGKARFTVDVDGQPFVVTVRRHDGL